MSYSFDANILLYASDESSEFHARAQVPRARVIQETASFALDYAEVSKSAGIYGNLVPDAHIATILRQHGVRRFYTADTDFKKFGFLEVVNPLA